MKKLLTLVVLTVALSKIQADEAGLQISVVPEFALEPPTTTIHGFALNLLCGQNPQQGITLGLYNMISEKSCGFTLGLVNYADSYTGYQRGVVNLATENFSGWQDGLINYTGGEFHGLQSGVINVSGSCNGLQFGVFNYTDKLHGLQIGVLNITTENRWFNRAPSQLAPAFPLLNWSF